MNIEKILYNVRNDEPLVQCITNFVTVNDCANILLAIGATPTMAMDIREVEEAVLGVNGLVCNMGAIEHIDSMILAGKTANKNNIPVVLDPVGAGSTSLRRDAVKKLIQEVDFAVIRGNASEIKAIAGANSLGRGVDAAKEDVVSERTLDKDIRTFEELARKINTVIAVSGETDIVTDGTTTYIIHNGCKTMARITGSGCMLTTLIGGICGGNKKDILDSTLFAVVTMGIAGQIADEKRIASGTGNATFRNDMIDALFNITNKQIEEKQNYEIYKRRNS